MALRNQPYLPLYVNDFSNDVSVKMCSSSAIGVYIMFMCLLHKSTEYGVLVLPDKAKKYENQLQNFSVLLRRLMPYEVEEILSALKELLDNKVLTLEGDKLFQKRMVKDGIISDKRSKAGKKGGEKTRDKAKSFAQAKLPAGDIPEEIQEPDMSLLLDPDIEEKKSGLIDNITSYFKYTAPKHRKQQTLIYGFVHSLPYKGKLDDFIQEFQAYKDLIDLRGFPLKFENFIGDQKEKFENGKWDDNWMEQLIDYKNKPKQVNGYTNKSGTEGIRSNVNPTTKRGFRNKL